MPLIVGGGPAGAAAAIELARGGAHAIVLERSTGGHDALCGGFLSWKTTERLTGLGIDPGLLGGHRVDRLRLIAGRRSAEFALPAPGVGISRRALDAALLDQAAAIGADVRRGVAVRGIEHGVVRTADGCELRPDRLVLATGKHDLRGAARPVTDPDPAMGLRWRFPASDALAVRIAGTIELHLFGQGYAGLVLQEDRHANLCLAIRGSAFAAAGGRPERVLAALLHADSVLGDRLNREALGEAQAIANIPYGWLARAGDAVFYRVGDQAGVIPSLAGEGVGIALASGAAAARAILSGHDPARFQPALAKRLARPIGIAGMLWRAAERPRVAQRALPLLARFPNAAGAAMRLTRI